MLAINTRNDKTIKGITVNDTEYKLSMLADDTALIIKDLDSLDKTIKIFAQFRCSSRLKLNLNKII